MYNVLKLLGDILSRVLSHDELLEAVKEVCSNAEEELLVCSAWVTLGGLRQIFSNLREGVKVRVLMRASELRDLQITDSRTISYLKASTLQTQR